MPTKQKLAALTAVLSALIGVTDLSQMVGVRPGAAQLITLFASGFGAGAALVAALRPKLRAQQASVETLGVQNGIQAGTGKV